MKHAVIALLLTAPFGVHATNVCTMGELTREVTVVYSNPGQETPCEVLYEKPNEGQSMTLWRAENEVGYCEARAEEFVDKLGTLGWSCTSSNANDIETANSSDTGSGPESNDASQTATESGAISTES